MWINKEKYSIFKTDGNEILQDVGLVTIGSWIYGT